MARRLVSSFVVLTVFLSSFSGVLLHPETVSAQFEPLRWSPIRTPSEEDFVVVTPSEVSALVLGSSDVWYASDIPNEKLYRTEDGGITWSDEIGDQLIDDADTPSPFPVWDLAVAPDDDNFIVAVTDDRQQLYLSDDGGEEWGHITDSADWGASLRISDVAISLENEDGKRDIAVATRDPDDGITDGDVWIAQDVQAGSLVSWASQGLDMDVSSVAFSPNYWGDRIVLAVVSDGAGTYLATGRRDFDLNTIFLDVTVPPLIPIGDTTDGPLEDELIYPSIVVPPSYDGEVATRRIVYVGYTSEHGEDDVYKIDDTFVWPMGIPTRPDQSDMPVYSMALHGNLLMVGEVDAGSTDGRARVHICDNPAAPAPTNFNWFEPEVRPSGGYGTGVGNAIVAFTPDGSWAVCGTSTNSVTTAADWANTTLPGPWSGSALDESAISRAARGDDYGIWNQISLIDTDIDELVDYSLRLVEDDHTLYLASVGSGMNSIWRSYAVKEDELGERWERIEFFDGPDDVILRRPPGTGATGHIYYAVRGTNQLYESTNRGQTWSQVRNCPDELTDVAIVHSERIYVLTDELLTVGRVEQIRQWEVWRWTYDIDTGLQSGNTLRFFGSSFIFVGDDGDGEIAVSKDGGETFELLPALPQPGTVHFVLDEDFVRNRTLYAATEIGMSAIYRWVIDGATSWTTLQPPQGGYSGLAHLRGVLYGAFGEGVVRTLVPRNPTVNVIDWDMLTVGLTAGTDFRPDTLRTSTNDMVNIWAIDGRPYDYDAEIGRLWVYSDTFVVPTPWPVSPALNEVLPCDMCGCVAELFCFQWKPMPKAETWDLWIAMDENFRYVIHKEEDITPVCCDSPGICDFEVPFIFKCDTTYYWRVRAVSTTEGERVRSRWSPSMHFLVGAGSTVEGMHVAPIIWAPEPGARDVPRDPEFSWTGFQSTDIYELEIAADEHFSTILARERPDGSAYVYPGLLEWGETYFWRVRALRSYPSEWSHASFTVMEEPEPLEQLHLPEPPSLVIPPGQPAATPLWVWLIIGVLSFLILCVAVFIVIGRRR